MHADEFNELIGDEFVPLLNKAGGAGFQVTAYTQTWSDVEARIGNRAKAGQVAGNFNTLVMLRVKELATAEMLTDQLPRVEAFTLMSVSGVDDSSDPASGIDFRSRNEDRISVSEVPLLTPAELVALPKGQAFALLEGGQLWKLRMPFSRYAHRPFHAAGPGGHCARDGTDLRHRRPVVPRAGAVGTGCRCRLPARGSWLKGLPALRRPDVRQGLVSQGLTTAAQALKWLALSLLFSILVEWAGMVFWWPEQGLDHSRSMLVREIRYLDTDFRRSLLTPDPARFARNVADRTYHCLFEVTGLTAFIRWVSPLPGAQETGLRPALHRTFRPAAKFAMAAMQVIQVFSVRLAVLSLATPVFVLFGLVALVDGLVRRDLRRWGGGRESSFVYHYARRAVLPLVGVAWVAYLALPFSLHPAFIVLPFAALVAFAITVTASTFKKYL